MTTVHFVYRSTARDNGKNRPPFFSKSVALESFARAARHVRSTMTFLNDGPVSPEHLRRMDQLGEVDELPRVGNSRSYRVALSLLDRSSWSDDDLVYFAEDDYLYVEEAFVALIAAAASVDEADFFTLYDHPDYRTRSVHRPRRYRRRRHWPIGDITWRPVRSTCMTFGARVGPMRQLSWLHMLGSRRACPDDFELWSASQRARGFRIMGSTLDPWSLADRELLKLFVKRSVAHPPRLLIAPSPGLACHMEEPYLSEDRQWGAVAALSERAG